jgi:hypothetical protein
MSPDDSRVLVFMYRFLPPEPYLASCTRGRERKVREREQQQQRKEANLGLALGALLGGLALGAALVAALLAAATLVAIQRIQIDFAGTLDLDLVVLAACEQRGTMSVRRARYSADTDLAWLA